MLSLEEAQSRILAAVKPPAPQWVPLASAARRVIAEDVHAAVDLPGFDNSAMDGYAVRAADVADASAGTPARLRVIAEIPAGTTSPVPISTGTAARIFTGSPMPAGADAVAMQEDARRNGDTVEILDVVKPLENVRLRGEDVRAGAVIAESGTIIRAGTLALLGAAGVRELLVFPRPTVGLISTGNELREAGETLGAGEIYESNRLALECLATDAGAQVRPYPIVRDTLENTTQVLRSALAECDLVVTTGGVSVGEHDYVKAALEEAGGTLDFWRVAIRPGKPFVFGQAGSKLLFGLPGNPVSAFVTFQLLVAPALYKMAGRRETGLSRTPGVLAERVSNASDRRHFMRVTVDASGAVRSAGPQASHRFDSLARANALLDLEPGTVLESGASVQVLRWDTI
jgi:molybdopterin molybdotransferase